MNVIFQLVLLPMFAVWSIFSFASESDLPLSENDIHRIEYPPGMQTHSAATFGEQGITLIYDHFDGYDWKKYGGRLKYSQLKIDKSYISASKPKPIEQDATIKFRTEVSSVVHSGAEWFYFVESESTYFKPATIFRARWQSNQLVHKQLLSLSTPIAAASSPKWYLLDDSKVALVYRSKPYPGCCSLLIAISNDGVSFGEAVEIGSVGSMPALAQFSSAELIYTFQTQFTYQGGDKHGMRTHFRLSSNQGKNWTIETPITDRVEEVHDAAPVQRKDGLVDVYYSSIDSKENEVFSLWRRCVSSTGELGPEELVIEKRVGNIAKVSPHRLKDGLLLITFVEQGEVFGEVDHSLHAARLHHDSACGL
ncbi:hypothetical protein K0504_11965 [Neiella marina]|uniref:Sialidase domain-containing protein n=1 Tax=Neiella holothuriorum TaxID=2870530 RepID=A0ABS7EJB7_9GAMM|nr:hypothetical protein [Neiella holothuriorum]MBW8191752.1 hypothetical protein [Neiella holothuriorum]